jgi:hypothetical protein
LILELTTNKEGSTIRKTIYEYDNKGMLILKKTENEKGEVIYLKEIKIEY